MRTVAFTGNAAARAGADVTHIIGELNDRQRDAVTAPPGNMLVVAGAGSGKTRVLVHRVAWLIEAEGISPHAVLAVTFTNKAAAEMRGRIEQLLREPARALWVGTFHGIAHRLLRLHWRDAGLPENFQILDSDDQLRLVKRVMRAFDLDEARFPPRQAQWYINGQKDEGLRAKDVVPGADFHSLTYRKVYEAYEELCRGSGLVDFGELLLRSHELWVERPSLLEHYRRRFRHLLVDEFQDTNAIQYAWLRVLAGSEGRVMAVGDDDQSIYGWRGARIENIHRFRQDFREVAIVRLEQNYRSTSTILKAANALIDHNPDRLGKTLWTAGETGEPILLFSGYNETDEARFIAERIEEWIEQGGALGEVGVLYRSNAQSRALEEALLRSGIAYRIYGGLRFFERAEIKDALAYMRLMRQPHSDTAFERVVNVPTRGIGERTVEVIRSLAREQGVSMWHAAKQGVANGSFKGRAGAAILEFIELIERLSAEVATRSLAELAEHVIEKSGLMDFHSREKGERGLARKENLEELVVACRQFAGELILPLDESGVERPGQPMLEEFLDHAALESGELQGSSSGDAVQLMTLHSAKGLEFPVVFMAGMEHGLFPHRMALQEPGRMEEERRLCYVGITRAMQQLYFTFAESRRQRGGEARNIPSCFLDEIPRELMQEVRLGGSVRVSLESRGVREGPLDEDAVLRMGQRVRHPLFGEGVVVQCEGHGARTRVQVNFREGPKWLMLGYAKLEPLD